MPCPAANALLSRLGPTALSASSKLALFLPLRVRCLVSRLAWSCMLLPRLLYHDITHAARLQLPSDLFVAPSHRRLGPQSDRAAPTVTHLPGRLLLHRYSVSLCTSVGPDNHDARVRTGHRQPLSSAESQRLTDLRPLQRVPFVNTLLAGLDIPAPRPRRT